MNYIMEYWEKAFKRIQENKNDPEKCPYMFVDPLLGSFLVDTKEKDDMVNRIIKLESES